MKYDGYSQLVKAGPRRLQDAQELLETPTLEPRRSDARYRHLCGAHYLAGYAVECLLKVYVILLLDQRSDQHFSRWSHVITHFTGSGLAPSLSGAKSHDLRKLMVAAELEPQLDSDRDMKQNWGICSRWDYNTRYRPEHLMDRDEVVDFVDACEATCNWLKNRVPFIGQK